MKDPEKIIKLTIKPEPEESFSFLGIVSSEPDYKLSYLLNKKLGITLASSADLVLNDKTFNKVPFSRFTSSDKRFTLLSNRSGQALLLQKLNKLDFFFIPSPGYDNEIEDFSGQIRKTEGVTAVFIFNSKEIKDKNIVLLQHLTE